MKHFKLTNETKVNAFGVTLFRIELTIDCKWGDAGDKGGWVEKENNLSGNAWVSGNAEVYGNADINSNNDYCGFQNFGSSNRFTTFFKTKNKEVIVRCGCFDGNLLDFETQVKKTHGDNKFAQEYLAMVALVKIKFGL